MNSVITNSCRADLLYLNVRFAKLFFFNPQICGSWNLVGVLVSAHNLQLSLQPPAGFIVVLTFGRHSNESQGEVASESSVLQHTNQYFLSTKPHVLC